MQAVLCSGIAARMTGQNSAVNITVNSQYVT